VKFKSLLPAFVLAILASLWLSASVAVSAQDAPKAALPVVEVPGETAIGKIKAGSGSPNPLALTDAERKALEPLQQAIAEAEQELANAGNALYLAKNDAVLTAAYRWKAAATAFNFALANRSNWIAATAKAKGCDGCELNLQTMELQKAKQ
jgi:hypothetical protein